MSQPHYPARKGSPAIKFGETGDHIKVIQDFLSKQDFYIKEQEFMTGFGSHSKETITDGNNYGRFSSATAKVLFDYQRLNSALIMKSGNLDAAEFEKEKNVIGFATILAMKSQGLVISPTQAVQPITSQPTPPAAACQSCSTMAPASSPARASSKAAAITNGHWGRPT